MKPMLNVSAAVLFAAMSVAPALAFISTASLMWGVKADVAPVATLDAAIGQWKAADLTLLNGAASITVFDAKLLYNANDLKLVQAADTKMTAELATMHTAITGDAALKAWFEKNKIDVNRVVAVTDVNGKIDVYLY